MTLALIHDPSLIAGSGSALMEGFLRRSRAVDLCDIIAGLSARQHAMHSLTREFSAAEDEAYSQIERDLEAARAELASIVRSRVGVSFDRLREAGL